MTADQYRPCASKIPDVMRREAKQVARLTTTRGGGGSLDAYHCGYAADGTSATAGRSVNGIEGGRTPTPWVVNCLTDRLVS